MVGGAYRAGTVSINEYRNLHGNGFDRCNGDMTSLINHLGVKVTVPRIARIAIQFHGSTLLFQASRALLYSLTCGPRAEQSQQFKK